MPRKTGILVIILAGLVWGLSEVFLGDVFYRFHFPMRAALLTAIGMAILVAGRLIYDRPGSSLASAVIASALRCLVPKLYVCHLIAITLEGCAFDASWSALRAGETRSMRRTWLASAIAVYVGFFSFGLAGAYLFSFKRWVIAGLGGIAQWGFRSGTVSALLLVGLVPVAVLAVRRLVAARSHSEETTRV
jgi:hypothetical protein